MIDTVFALFTLRDIYWPSAAMASLVKTFAGAAGRCADAPGTSSRSVSLRLLGSRYRPDPDPDHPRRRRKQPVGRHQPESGLSSPRDARGRRRWLHTRDYIRACRNRPGCGDDHVVLTWHTAARPSGVTPLPRRWPSTVSARHAKHSMISRVPCPRGAADIFARFPVQTDRCYSLLSKGFVQLSNVVVAPT